MHKLFKITLILITILFILNYKSNGNTLATHLYRSGDPVKGKEYNDLLKMWIDKDITIWVGISEDGMGEVYVYGETGLGNAVILLDLNYSLSQGKSEIITKFENAVLKAIKWSAIARENKADVSKGLGCFGKSDKYGLCEKNSNAFDEGQMSLSFFSANNGNQTDLIISIIDEYNQFIKTTVYINTHGMKELLRAIKSINNAFKKAKDAETKKDLFK